MNAPHPPTSIEVDPRVDARWDELQQHGGSLFTSPAWIAAVATTYGLTPSARLLVDAHGSVTAGVAYCDIDNLRGHAVVSFPFSDYQEPLGASLDDVAMLLNSFVEGPPSRFTIPEHRVPDGMENAGFERRCDLLRHRIDVDPSVECEAQFAALDPKVRQNIRRSRRAGVEVDVTCDLAALREFFDLHVAVRARKYRLLPQPFAFMEAIHAAFARQGHIMVALARLDGRAIAGTVYLEMGDTLYYKFNASDADELGVRPNEDLVWAGMRICSRRGLTGIDLGVSDADQLGLVRYKRKLAEHEHGVVTLSSAGTEAVASPERLAEASELLAQLTGVFTGPGVEREVVERAGELLYRYFA